MVSFAKRVGAVKASKSAATAAPEKAAKQRPGKVVAPVYVSQTPASGRVVMTEDGIFLNQADLAAAVVGYTLTAKTGVTITHSPWMKALLEGAIPPNQTDVLKRAADAKMAASSEDGEDEAGGDGEDEGEVYSPWTMLAHFLPVITSIRGVSAEIRRTINGNDEVLETLDFDTSPARSLTLADLYESSSDEGDAEDGGAEGEILEDPLSVTLNGKEISAPKVVENYLNRVLTIAGQITNTAKLAALANQLGADAEEDAEYIKLKSRLDRTPLDRLITSQEAALEALGDVFNQAPEHHPLHSLADAKEFLQDDNPAPFKRLIDRLQDHINRLNSLRADLED